MRAGQNIYFDQKLGLWLNENFCGNPKHFRQKNQNVFGWVFLFVHFLTGCSQQWRIQPSVFFSDCICEPIFSCNPLSFNFSLPLLFIILVSNAVVLLFNSEAYLCWKDHSQCWVLIVQLDRCGCSLTPAQSPTEISVAPHRHKRPPRRVRLRN